ALVQDHADDLSQARRVILLPHRCSLGWQTVILSRHARIPFPVLFTSPLAGPRFASTRQRPRITVSPGLARRRRLVSRTNRRASPDTWSGRRGRGRSTRQLLQQDRQLVHVEGFGQLARGEIVSD